MGRKKSLCPRKIISLTLDSKLYEYADLNGWKFRDLLEFAIKFKLAEIDPDYNTYPDNRLTEKIEKLTALLNNEQNTKVFGIGEREPTNAGTDSEIKKN